MNLSSRFLKKETATRSEQPLQFISFFVGDEIYATDILKIHEITNYRDLTRIPSAPSFVKGVLDLKGIAVPVMDLREKFALPARPYSKFSVIMVVDVSGRIMGVIVDSVADVLQIDRADIQPAPKFSATLKAEFIKGMIKQGDNRFIVLLDMDRMLSDRELDMVESL
ncbi:MAG TPA: chemotaxis protein CheW [bacterium]|nr:chemotaxis protein CheW [bacterium]